MVEVTLRSVEAGGYLLLFLGSILEAVPFVGSFIPGQLMVILAGILAAGGVLDLKLVIVTSLVGNILGQVAGYTAGRFVGRPILDAVGPRFRLSDNEIAASERLFNKYGPFAVFVGQFSFLTRGVVNLFAGMSRMPGRAYWPVSLAAATLWAVGYALLGFVFGTAFRQVQALLGVATVVLGVMVAAGWVLWVRYRYRRARARGEET